MTFKVDDRVKWRWAEAPDVNPAELHGKVTGVSNPNSVTVRWDNGSEEYANPNDLLLEKPNDDS